MDEQVEANSSDEAPQSASSPPPGGFGDPLSPETPGISALPLQLQVEMTRFFSEVDREFNVEECAAELREAEQRFFELQIAKARQTETNTMKQSLPPLVNRKLEHREATNFGLTELALPAGSAVDPMPAFRWAKFRNVLRRAATPDSLEKVVLEANAKGLFLGAKHLRDAFVFLGTAPLRERLWKLCARTIPEKEDIDYAMSVLPAAERRRLTSLTRNGS